MATLTTLEKIKLERYFGMDSGYFGNFSNNTLSKFVSETLGCEIYDEKYNLNSGSKANRVRALWSLEDDNSIALFIEKAIAYDDMEKSKANGYTGVEDESLRAECLEIAMRLRNNIAQPQPQPQFFSTMGNRSTSSYASTLTTLTPAVKNKVFIVHGHDVLVKEMVARFVSQLGLIPIILHEQVSASQTILEKIERYANEVCYAIVLYTPCDKGAKANENIPKFRARQNVVFEHGYFIAKLGRQNVTAILKGDLEIPNDYSGVIYINFDDNNGWKLDLVREMKSAGCTVNLERILN